MRADAGAQNVYDFDPVLLGRLTDHFDAIAGNRGVS